MTHPSITQQSWVLVQLADLDGHLTEALADVEATLEFAADRIGGSASCNRFSSSGDLTDLPETMALTMMMCPEPVMEQERRYLSLLPMIESVEIEQGLLVARGPSGEPLLVWKQSSEAS